MLESAVPVEDIVLSIKLIMPNAFVILLEIILIAMVRYWQLDSLILVENCGELSQPCYSSNSTCVNYTTKATTVCISNSNVNCSCDYNSFCQVFVDTNGKYYAACDCKYGGKYPDCVGVPCGAGYCTKTQTCMSDQSGKPACVEQSAISQCSSCVANSRCYVVSSTSVDCMCNYPTDVYPNCQAATYCAQNVYCLDGETCLAQQTLCVNSTEYNAQCADCPITQSFANCVDTGTSLECQCNKQGGSWPNCKSLACDVQYCFTNQTCMPTTPGKNVLLTVS